MAHFARNMLSQLPRRRLMSRCSLYEGAHSPVRGNADSIRNYNVTRSIHSINTHTHTPPPFNRSRSLDCKNCPGRKCPNFAGREELRHFSHKRPRRAKRRKEANFSRHFGLNALPCGNLRRGLDLCGPTGPSDCGEFAAY